MLGIGVGIIVIPLTWVLMRNKPEEYGLLPDGVAKNPDVAIEEEGGWTLREAMGTAIFWVFIFSRIVSPAWGTGLIIHQISIFEQVGHTARTAAETYAMITIIMAMSSLGFGVLVDKLRPGLVMALQLSALIAAMIVATSMTTQILLYIYALSFGLVMGGGGVFDGAVWANLFGRKYHGSIRGFVTTIGVAGSALGPVIFGISFDYFGGYAPVLWLGAVLACIGAIGAAIVPLPRKPKIKHA